jgi:hypothetical protein
VTPPRTKAARGSSNGAAPAQPEPDGSVIVHVFRDEHGNTQLVPGAVGDVRVTEIGDVLRSAAALWEHQQRQRIIQ